MENDKTMNERNLSQKDFGWMKDALSGIDSLLSEYCFPNLFLFRKKHQYKVIHSSGMDFLSGVSYDGSHYLMPLLNLNTAPPAYIEELKSLLRNYDMLFPISEEWLVHFPDDIYARETFESDGDYLYTNEQMIEFPGKKMQKKRNLLKQFRKLYSFSVENISEGNKGACREVLDLWQGLSPQTKEGSDYESSLEAIECFDALNLDGLLIRVDGKPVGFTIGERINSQMAAIHIAKGNPEVKGVNQFLFSEYASVYCQEVNYINLEQDLGEPGLRQTKRSYRPVRIVQKYRISERNFQ